MMLSWMLDSRQEEIGHFIDKVVSYQVPSDNRLFEGTAFELLEIIALGYPNELPADATRMSGALSEIEPRLKEVGVTVDRFWKNKQKS